MVKEHASIESNKKGNTKKTSFNIDVDGDFKQLKWPIKRHVFFNSELMLDYNINQLPPNLKYRIYIKCMRDFWRKYVPLTAQIQPWQHYALHIQDVLYKARKNNIHFLHLPFNTLYKNRSYIVGCQCDRCWSSSDRSTETAKQISNSGYYKKKQQETYSYWNDEYEYFWHREGLPIFDPNRDIYENIEDKIKGPPIYFKHDNYVINPDNV